jgi:hypothetical protein
VADTIRTGDQLVAIWQDNVIGLITAQDGRDFIVSCFGALRPGVPSVDCDEVDTVGIGSFFAEGSTWIKTLGYRYYVCLNGAAGAAVWQALMFDGQAAGGDLGGFYPNPTVAPAVRVHVRDRSLAPNVLVGAIQFDVAEGLNVVDAGGGVAEVHLLAADAGQAGAVSLSSQILGAGNKFVGYILTAGGTTLPAYHGVDHVFHARGWATCFEELDIYHSAGNLSSINYIPSGGTVATTTWDCRNSAAPGMGAGISLQTTDAGSGLIVLSGGAAVLEIVVEDVNGVQTGGTATTGGLEFYAGLYISGTSTAVTSITAGTGLSGGGSGGAITVALAVPVTPARGGSGTTSGTAYAVWCAGTTSTGTWQQVSGVGTSGQVLTSAGAGALPTWTTLSGGSLPDPVTVPHGGTGDVTLTQFGVLLGQGTSAVTLAVSTSDAQFLRGGAGIADPSFDSVTYSDLGVSESAPTEGQVLSYHAASGEGLRWVTLSGGSLPDPVTPAHGGSGTTTGTAYAVWCAGTTSTGTWQQVSGVGTSGQVLTSNGASALPTWQTPAAGGAWTTGAITATGSTQGGAAALNKNGCTVSGADGTKGVVLVTGNGMTVVRNSASLSSLKVYPPSGAQISTTGTNNPETLSGLTSQAYVEESATQWRKVTVT